MSNVDQQTQDGKVRGVADIVFCFDCTGSMQPCIDQVKRNVADFVKSLEGGNGEAVCDWRVKVVGYRDFNFDAEKIINNMPFVTDAAAFEGQLSSLKADGGDDEPESTFDAFWYVIKETEWRNKCHKMLVVFTDATPLPVHQDTIDKFAIMGDSEFFYQVMENERIKLFFFGKKCETYEDLNQLNRAEINLYKDPKAEFQSADFKKILEKIGKTISESATEPLKPLC